MTEKKVHINIGREYVTGNKEFTIGTLKSWYENGRLVIPSFQRSNDVWSKNQQRLLIDSIFRNYPIPQIVLTLAEDNVHYIAIDGQQRLTAILDFINNKFPLVNIPGIKTCYYKNIETLDQETFLQKDIHAVIINGMPADEQSEYYLRLQNGAKHNAIERLVARNSKVIQQIRDEVKNDEYMKKYCTGKRMKALHLMFQLCMLEERKSKRSMFTNFREESIGDLIDKYKDTGLPKETIKTVHTILGKIKEIYDQCDVEYSKIGSGKKVGSGITMWLYECLSNNQKNWNKIRVKPTLLVDLGKFCDRKDIQTYTNQWPSMPEYVEFMGNRLEKFIF